jgi:hypothetical protein
MKPLSRTTIKHLSGPTILNTLPDGAYITALDRNILFWNNAAAMHPNRPCDITH